MNKNLWDVQEKVNGEWISIYSSPFEAWHEAKTVFDEALMSQKAMNQDNELRLIKISESQPLVLSGNLLWENRNES